MLTAAVLMGSVIAGGACGDDGSPEASRGLGESVTTAPTPVPSTAGSAGPTSVAITGFVFDPSPVRIRAGETVTWTNQDAVPHSIQDTSPLATPVSPSLAQGDSFSITYPRPGTYPYVCGIHISMEGSVEVTD